MIENTRHKDTEGADCKKSVIETLGEKVRFLAEENTVLKNKITVDYKEELSSLKEELEVNREKIKILEESNTAIMNENTVLKNTAKVMSKAKTTVTGSGYADKLKEGVTFEVDELIMQSQMIKTIEQDLSRASLNQLLLASVQY